MKNKFSIAMSLALMLTMLVTSMAFAGASSMPTSQSDTPTIASDLPDYGPGDTVHLYGAGWQAGESVHIFVNDSVGSSWSLNSDPDPVADGNGGFTYQFQLPNWFVATYGVTATGPVSGTAMTTFTDAVNFQIRGKDDGQHQNVPNEEDLGSFAQGTSVSLTCPRGTGLTLKASGLGSSDSVSWSLAYASGYGNNTSLSPLTTLAPTTGTFSSSSDNACAAMTITTSSLSVGTTYHGKLTLSRTSGVSANSTDYFFKFSVTAGNAAPNAGTISGDSPVNEGSSHSYSSDASDPDVGDTLSYTWSVTSGNASIGSGQGTSSVTLNFGDGLSTVVLHLVVDDGHGHSVSPTDKSITVNNVAPTVTLSGDNSANEGQTKSYTFTTSDPGQDTFSLVSESCGANGTLSNAAFNGTTGAGSFDCTFADGPASSIVSVQVKDSDDANSNTDTITVAIANVAPTATFAATSPINEGSSSSLSLSSPSDPSSADTTAGFKYSFACDGLDASLATTYAGAGTSSTANCPFDDNGSYTVKGRIFDKDNGYNTYQATVLVNNVAPTATFGNNGPVNEGSSATVSFSNQYDPSSADMTAGFHYAFACDNGDLSGATYAGSSASASTNCTFYDNGTYTVKGRIIDKDGGYTEYTTAVVVNNVAPEITSVVAGAAASCGTNNTITVNFTDPGTLDTWSASIDWGDGNTENLVSVTSPFGASHIYTNAGVHTVTVVVTDDDGGVSASKTAQVTLNFNLSGILQPVNPGPPNSIFKYKSTIPVKIQVQDCNGTYPSGLAIKIQVFLTSGATPGTEVNEPYSTSAADTTGFMRFTGAPDNQYIYNLATRSLPDTSGTYQIKLTIMLTNQIVTANFGLRP